MNENLYNHNVTDELIPIPTPEVDPMIVASYYESPSYQPIEDFYDFKNEVFNYTYYYNDQLYEANYTGKISVTLVIHLGIPVRFSH